MTRIEREFELLRTAYPNAILDPSRQWVEVPDFPLPDGRYPSPSVRVRMALTAAYPDVAPDNFFVPAGFVLRDGGSPSNYSDVEKFGGRWGQFSWHPRTWRAAPDPERGDSLCTFFNSVRKRLEEGS